MDLTIRGETSCTQCHEEYEGKMMLHLQEDLNGQLRTIPPLEENELQDEEIAFHYQYGPVKGVIDAQFICPNCQTENEVRIEIPSDVLDPPI